MVLFSRLTILPRNARKFPPRENFHFYSICLGVQSHPEDQGEFGRGLTVNISECNNLLELCVYNMCWSYMVLTNPHIKHWIQFIIMMIFMKIVKICPKFTVVDWKRLMFLCFEWKCWETDLREPGWIGELSSCRFEGVHSPSLSSIIESKQTKHMRSIY